MNPLITVDELHQALQTGETIRILDVRWRLDQPDGRTDFEKGHIPGAVYVDLDHELASHAEPATQGRHPLPRIEDLQSSAQQWGLNHGDHVVVYDDAKSTSAARAWWLLRYAGVDSVQVLDGAFSAWKDAGLDVATDLQGSTALQHKAPDVGNITLEYGAMPTLDFASVTAFTESGILLDARAPERYTGEFEPIDPRSGHIPGAINAPTATNVDAEGFFLSPEALLKKFSSLGVSENQNVAAYCGSGITAAHEILALNIAGITASLYPGSFSQWSNHPELPIATGSQPLTLDANEHPNH